MLIWTLLGIAGYLLDCWYCGVSPVATHAVLVPILGPVLLVLAVFNIIRE